MAAKTAAPKTKTPTTTDWLAPLTNKQVTAQAKTTINKAYNPAYTDLNSQAGRAQGISDKRTADNKYYLSWLDSKMAELQSHADAAHQQLMGLEQGLQTQQNALYGGQQQGLVDQANARAGNVSNNAQSTALGADIHQNQAANMGHLNSVSTEALQGIDTANGQLGGTRANNFNVVQSAQTKQLSDLNIVLGKIADARLKLTSQKTADLAKEIARLQGVEIQKQQSNRDYQAAATKLGITLANTQSEIQTRAGQLAVSQQNASTNAANVKSQINTRDATYKLNVAKYNTAVAKDIYQRDHGLGPYKVSRGSGSKPPLTQASQNAIYHQIGGIQGQLNDLIANYHYTPSQAWHLLHNGGYVSTPAGANGKPGTRHISAVGDDGLLNAAYNTRTGAAGLTPGDINYLKRLGLANPGNRLTVSQNQPSNAGHGAVP